MRYLLPMQIDYRQKTTISICDMHQEGRVVFLIDVYGKVNEPDLINRMGLDPNRYQIEMEKQ